MRRVITAFLLTAAFTVSLTGTALAEPITVDCGAGDSLQAAIILASSETPLEVFGVCNERIVIDRPLTIIGGDPGAAIDGSGSPGNAVTIESDSVFIRNLSIRGAQQSPQAIDSTGHGVFDNGAHTFSLIDVTVEDNDGFGLLMFDSYLTITKSRVRNNGSTGIALLGGCCGIIGADSIVVRGNAAGGIFTDGDQSLVLTNSKVKHNVGTGIHINEDGYIADSVIRYNTGGGVSSLGTGRIVRSWVVDNAGWGVSHLHEVLNSAVARNGGGGIEQAAVVHQSIVWNNSGIGVDCSTFECAVTESVVGRNRGAGVKTTGPTKIIDSRIVHNRGTGVVADSDVSIESSLISRNAGSNAGALEVMSGTVDVINSTIRRNVASSGATFVIGGRLNLVNSTVFHNSAPDGVFANSGITRVNASIVSAHVGATAHCTGGAIASSGYNVVKAPGCAWIASDTIAAPLLAPFAFNGGPTATHALLPGSPAIDAIPATACLVSVDQRGEPRPAGAGCDSGAYEVQP